MGVVIAGDQAEDESVDPVFKEGAGAGDAGEQFSDACG